MQTPGGVARITMTTGTPQPRLLRLIQIKENMQVRVRVVVCYI